MTHIIVATHGKFSEEIVNSAAMVFGEDENCHVVTFLPGEGGEHLVEKYNAIIATLPENEPVLDAKNGASLPELVETAKEVGVAAVKSFRQPKEDLQPATPPAQATKPAEAEKPTALSGNMNISLLRIDSRLIHGQVATSWAKAVKCEAIFAVNDDVANDPLRRDLLLQVVPPHLKAYVIPVEKAIKVYHNPKYAGKNILWLVTNPSDIVRLIDGGVKVEKVNVGGMTYREGNKLLSQAVAVNPTEVGAFKQLLEKGVELSLQQVAANPKVMLTHKELDAVKF